MLQISNLSIINLLFFDSISLSNVSQWQLYPLDISELINKPYLSPQPIANPSLSHNVM